ncbi:hypothetical protein [Oryza sativa Japonica Group]|uniref:Uncharacterized protein n=1 Tax=Oryza sativa subsp. japonica TaxID=39947 RepID=Q5QLX1_ORYSJ|nr:hypothetical protein [Oryza sativa Japonica Group]
MFLFLRYFWFSLPVVSPELRPLAYMTILFLVLVLALLRLHLRARDGGGATGGGGSENNNINRGNTIASSSTGAFSSANIKNDKSYLK